MRALNNLKIITKLAIPVIVMMAVTIGLIIFAKAGLDTLAEETQQIVDVHAARRSMALNIKASVSEAACQRGGGPGEEPDHRDALPGDGRL
jgi:hypothetical protein